jgi:LysM repeat protein
LAIAVRYGTTVARLAALNNLDPQVCFLRAGSTIRIPPARTAAQSQNPSTATAVPKAIQVPAPLPAPLPAPTEVNWSETYAVQPGDTCLEIARRYKITVARLAAANRLDPTTCFLSVGRKLVIPRSVAVVPVPTAVATAAAVVPRLLSPADGSTVGLTARQLTLTWVYDRALVKDEYFVVQVQRADAAKPVVFQTKENLLVLNRDVLGADFGSSGGRITWQVLVKRVTAIDPNTSALVFVDVAASALRSFTWQ